MNYKIILIAMLFISKVAFGQSDESYKNEFGLNMVSLLRNGNLELTYKRAMENCFLRSSLSASLNGGGVRVPLYVGGVNYPYFLGSRLSISSQSVELPNDSLLFHTNNFLKTSNYTLKAGLESRIKEGKFIIYYGMDLSLGLIRGRGYNFQEAYIGNPNKCGFEYSFGGIDFDANEQYYISYGALPFLGVKWPLGKRLFLNAEFAANSYYSRPNIEYKNHNGDYLTKQVVDYQISFKPFLNDLSISYIF